MRNGDQALQGDRATRRILLAYRFCGLGGVETSLLARAAALAGIGVEARVVFTETYGAGGHMLATHPRVTLAPAGSAELRGLLAGGFDAVGIVDNPEMVEFAAEAGVTAPILYETHSSLPSSLPRYYRNLAHPLIAAVVVPSSFNARLVREHGQARHVVVVPNTIDPERFRPQHAHPANVVPEWRPGEQLVLWVARLEDEKNPRELCTIACALLAAGKGLRILVVGDAPAYPSTCAALLDQVPEAWQSAFTFRRAVPYEEMPALYAAAAQTGGFLLSTSRHESAPMTLLEALACGCPVLSTAVGGVPEMIVHGVTGLLYEPGEVGQAVRHALSLLGGEEGTRDRLRAAGLQLVRTRHSPPAVARAYADLLPARPAPPGDGR